MNTQKELLEELRGLLSLMGEAETAAYEKPAGMNPLEAEPVVKHGKDHSDPTGDACVNEKRLLLSSRLARARAAIDESTGLLRGARGLLESGLDTWAGHNND